MFKEEVRKLCDPGRSTHTITWHQNFGYVAKNAIVFEMWGLYL